MTRQTATQTKQPLSFTPVSTGLLQRKCTSCGQHTIAGGECTSCQPKSGLQRKLTIGASNDPLELEADRIADRVLAAPTHTTINPSPSRIQRFTTQTDDRTDLAPANVDRVLSSPGRPLETSLQEDMGQRFGHDFSHVRVHTDAEATRSAQDLDANAFTVGRNIVFGAGQFAPTTQEGKSLIAHELAHTIQQSQSSVSGIGSLKYNSQFEREADAGAHAILQHNDFRVTSATVPHIARQTSPTVPTTSTSTVADPMLRPEFEKTMRQRYRVKLIRTGTFQDQAFGDLTPDRWHSWDPGSSSTTYNWIVEAFSQVEKAFGGLPPVDKIVFFETDYIQTTPGHAEAQPTVGASYFNGQLIIYKKIMASNTMRQISDSFTQPTVEQAVHRNIAHELGHGIAETALDQPGTSKPPGAEPKMMDGSGVEVGYRLAVGWTAKAPDELYDIQVPGVEEALKTGTPPPADAHITKDKWYLSKWKERPLTSYMTDNPGDDFAEAIMAYVNEPGTLKALSPHRYEFLEKHKSKWLHPDKINIWESVKRGGQPRALQPSRKPTIWERTKP